MTETELIVEVLKKWKGKTSAEFHKEVFGMSEEAHDAYIRTVFGG